MPVHARIMEIFGKNAERVVAKLVLLHNCEFEMQVNLSWLIAAVLSKIEGGSTREYIGQRRVGLVPLHP